jgi:hypothetical protein
VTSFSLLKSILLVSFFRADAFTINYIVGVGILDMPRKFFGAGVILSPISVLCSSSLLVVTLIWTIEASARALGLAALFRRLNGEASRASAARQLDDESGNSSGQYRFLLCNLCVHLVYVPSLCFFFSDIFFHRLEAHWIACRFHHRSFLVFIIWKWRTDSSSRSSFSQSRIDFHSFQLRFVLLFIALFVFFTVPIRNRSRSSAVAATWFLAARPGGQIDSRFRVCQKLDLRTHFSRI